MGDATIPMFPYTMNNGIFLTPTGQENVISPD